MTRAPDIWSALLCLAVGAMVAAACVGWLDAPCVVDDPTAPHACRR